MCSCESVTAQGQDSEHQSRAAGATVPGRQRGRERKQREPGQTGRGLELLVISLFFISQHCILAGQGN